MLKYNNMPVRIVNTYIIEWKGRMRECYDLAYDSSKPYIVARSVFLNASKTKVIDD